MCDSEETTGIVRVAHVRIIAGEEDVVSGLVVGGEEATEFDLGLEDGADEFLARDGVTLELEAESCGCVGDSVLDGSIGLGGRGVEESAGHW